MVKDTEELRVIKAMFVRMDDRLKWEMVVQLIEDEMVLEDRVKALEDELRELRITGHPGKRREPEDEIRTGTESETR